ncbi:aladin [Drosophila sechellia]|nr:aladin [Drosophila sechellia]
MEPSNEAFPEANAPICNNQQPRRVHFERNNADIGNQTEQLLDLLWYLANKCWQWFRQKLEQLKRLCFRPKCNIDPEILERISQTRGWKTSAIRFIEFHPNTSLMALLTNDDVVLIFNKNCDCPTKIQSLKQKDTTCVAFRPWSQTCEFAVGCADGICLWWDSRRLNANSNIRHMMGTHQLQVLEDKGHNYVTTMQWNEDGTILVTAALGSSHIMLWKPDCQQKMRLISNPESLGSFSLLRFSPDFQELFCASCHAGASLCQLNSSDWKLKQIIGQQRIQTAVWTTCGSILLFGCYGSTRVYSCSSDGEDSVFLRPQSQWRVQLIMDLQSVTTLAGQQRCCGEPQCLAMDPLGIFMASIFKEQSFVLLSILNTSRWGTVKLLPVEFIDCDMYMDGDQYPAYLAFGVLEGEIRMLMIAWNSGYIQRYDIRARCFKEAKWAFSKI